MTQVTLNGHVYSDDGSAARDMQGGGVRNWLLPMLSDTMTEVAAIGASVTAAAASATTASNWAAQLGAPVSGGEYSAKYWAQQAASYAQAVNPSFSDHTHITLTTPLLPPVRPALLLDFANSQAVDSRIVFSRGSTATRWNAQGVMETVAAGQPRIDFDPKTGQCIGLLMEPAATNHLLYSSDIANAAWGKAGSSAGGAVVIKGVPLVKLVENTGTGLHSVHQSLALAAGDYRCASIYVYAAERSLVRVVLYNAAAMVDVRLNTATGDLTITTSGTPGTYYAGAQDCGGGLWRVWCSLTQPAGQSSIKIEAMPCDAGGSPSYLGNGASGIYIGGAQVEQRYMPTSYIATTSGAVTRSGDAAHLPASTVPGGLSSAVGSAWMCATFRSVNPSTVGVLASMGNADSGRMIYQGGSSNPIIASNDGTTTCASTGSVSIGQRTSAASSYGAAGQLCTRDGLTPVSVAFDGQMGAEASPGLLAIGSIAGGSLPAHAHIHQLAWWPQQFSASALQEMTRYGS